MFNAIIDTGRAMQGNEYALHVQIGDEFIRLPSVTTLQQVSKTVSTGFFFGFFFFCFFF